MTNMGCYAMCLDFFEAYISVKELFLEAVSRWRTCFIQLPLNLIYQPSNQINVFWTSVWTSVAFFLIAVAYRQLGSIEDAKQILKKNALEVHQSAGSLDSNTECIIRCIGILNQFPFLVNHPQRPYNYTPFLRACWSGNATLVRFMLLHGADIYSCTVNKETPIYLATYRVLKSRTWNPSVLNLLFEAGCPLSVPTVKGVTALHCATNAGHVSLTRWLLMHGAHLTLPKCKVTPYDYAIRSLDENHKSVAILLHLYCPEMVEKHFKKLSTKRLYTMHNSNPLSNLNRGLLF